jgi:hypothetical protein
MGREYLEAVSSSLRGCLDGYILTNSNAVVC